MANALLSGMLAGSTTPKVSYNSIPVPAPAPTPVPASFQGNYNPMVNPWSQGNAGRVLGASTSMAPTLNPTAMTSGMIAGSNPPAAAPTGAGGGTSGLSGGGSGSNAAQSATDAQLASANTAFDYNRSQLEGQLGSLGTQKTNTLSELQNSLNGVQTNVNQQKTDTQNMGEEQIGEAGSTAKNTQRSNRNVLRALGILNSTYASDALMSPMNEFDIQRAKIGQQVMDNVKKLDDFYNTQLANHQQAVKSVEDQYTTLVGQIQNDLRFNERQRLDAVQAANSALQQRLYDIGQSFTSYQNTVNTQKQNMALALTQLQIANPTADVNGIMNTNMAKQGYTLSGSSPTAAMVSPYNPDGSLKKQTLSGFGQ
jgi:hypothetical protein